MSGPRLKKGLGQHHLTRPEVCAPLVGFLRAADRLVVEVGAGGGVLTGELVALGARVVVVEVDPEWAFSPLLRRRGARIAVADAATLPWPRVPPGTLVTGNLPFQIATPLITEILPLHERVPRAAFLVQREVGERLAAAPGSSSYGSLSVLAAAAAEVRLLGRVPRGSFYPPPKVEGAFVGLELHELPVTADEWQGFCATVRTAFALRRKTLRNALAASWGRRAADAALEALGAGSRVRAEELGVGDFVRLHRLRPPDSP